MARLSVLQLDTHFPRIAGDIGCAETFQCELEIIRVPNTSVEKIVFGEQNTIDTAPFKEAISKATGDLIVTSCGFLAPFQEELSNATNTPFIASALIQLSKLKTQFLSTELQILTFDADQLNSTYLPRDCLEYENSIFGLDKHSHLYQTISKDLNHLDEQKAAKEISALCEDKITKDTKAILLECTNLPPYKKQISKSHNIEIFDILSAIEDRLAGSVCPQFL